MGKKFDLVAKTMKILDLKQLIPGKHLTAEQLDIIVDEALNLFVTDVKSAPCLFGLEKAKKLVPSIDHIIENIIELKKSPFSPELSKLAGATEERLLNCVNDLMFIGEYAKCLNETRACVFWCQNVLTNQHAKKEYSDAQLEVARNTCNTLGIPFTEI